MGLAPMRHLYAYLSHAGVAMTGSVNQTSAKDWILRSLIIIDRFPFILLPGAWMGITVALFIAIYVSRLSRNQACTLHPYAGLFSISIVLFLWHATISELPLGISPATHPRLESDEIGPWELLQ